VRVRRARSTFLPSPILYAIHKTFIWAVRWPMAKVHSPFAEAIFSLILAMSLRRSGLQWAEQGKEETSKFNFEKRSKCKVLCRRTGVDDRSQICISESLRSRILSLGHYPTIAGHPGGRKLYFTVQQSYYWPSMPIVAPWACINGYMPLEGFPYCGYCWIDTNLLVLQRG
jgi:hypothetical protein